MNKRPFIALIIGVLLLGLVSTALLMWRDRQYARVNALDAELKVKMYNIGIDYSGVLMSQNVQRGQVVQAGDLLGVLKSGSLMQKLRDSELQMKDLPYTVNDQSEIELRAAKPGVVKEIKFDSGSFVSANQDLYTIIDTSEYYVVSTFDVSEKMLQEINNDKIVNLKLQNDTVVPTKIRDITIERDGVKHNVTIESAPMTKLTMDSFKLGEPVKATLMMRDHDSLSTVQQWLGSTVQQARNLLHI